MLLISTGPRAQQSKEESMPWPPEDTTPAGNAVLRLQEFLLRTFNDQRGVHVETLMTAVGSLAGFSAQYAIRETVVKTGKLPEHGGADLQAGAFVIVTTKAGETFYFGDLLNSYLVPTNTKYGPGRYTLFGFVAPAVQQAGKQPLGFAEIREIFGRAASSAGKEEFGVLSLPANHQPKFQPREALNRLWPAAKLILSNTKLPGNNGRSVPTEYWPTVIAIVAQKLIRQTKSALDPTLSMQILFEAAIPMSKVDPKTVPQELPAAKQ